MVSDGYSRKLILSLCKYTSFVAVGPNAFVKIICLSLDVGSTVIFPVFGLTKSSRTIRLTLKCENAPLSNHIVS